MRLHLLLLQSRGRLKHYQLTLLLLIQEPPKLFLLEVLVLSVRNLLVIPAFPSLRSVKSLKGHTFSLHPISVVFNCSIDFLIWSPILNLTNN
jgi:cellulose biosynthesis protein BcsQ